jgi:hypothetical protein
VVLSSIGLNPSIPELTNETTYFVFPDLSNLTTKNPVPVANVNPKRDGVVLVYPATRYTLSFIWSISIFESNPEADTFEIVFDQPWDQIMYPFDEAGITTEELEEALVELYMKDHTVCPLLKVPSAVFTWLILDTTIGEADAEAKHTRFVPFPKFVVTEFTRMLLEETPNRIEAYTGVTESTNTFAVPALAV